MVRNRVADLMLVLKQLEVRIVEPGHVSNFTPVIPFSGDKEGQKAASPLLANIDQFLLEHNFKLH